MEIILNIKEWAEAHGYGDLYKQYEQELLEIEEGCEEEGYPSNGCNYELRVERLQEMYPELFGED